MPFDYPSIPVEPDFYIIMRIVGNFALNIYWWGLLICMPRRKSKRSAHRPPTFGSSEVAMVRIAKYEVHQFL